MSLAIVKADIAPLYSAADENAPVLDEALYGMTVTVLDAPAAGWKHVRTAYRMEGYLPDTLLCLDGGAAEQWEAYGKMMARAPYVDVLSRAEAAAPRMACLPRGGLVHPLGQAQEGGWLPVGLPGGKEGWVKQGNMMAQPVGRPNMPEKQLREALATTALSYLGTQYRSGGKSPMGIDGAGLVSVAYLLNGITIFRGAALPQGFALQGTTREKLQMGDVVLFEGHVAMYLGDGKYVHSTSWDGSDGVVINSLLAGSPFYREDLAGRIAGYGSIFTSADA